jgi:eukaryotic-like serine/threonine-protein kinase
VLRPGASGSTTVSRVKTLLLHAQDKFGRAEADAFLLSTRLDRDYLEDETRPLPVERWHAALVAFASRWGREELQSTMAAVVHPENLGVWARVLRGASGPASAFRQLDQHGGEHALTERWSTTADSVGFWRGSVPLAAEPLFERDGLCALARAVELAAVPLLFGLEPGQTRIINSGGPDRSGRATQEFEVRWREQGVAPIWIGGAVGLLSSGSAAVAADTASVASTLAALTGGSVGALTGFIVVHDRRRRTQSTAQLMRIQALERSATLRDSRERGAEQFRKGSVIAGQYRLTEQLGAGASGAIWEATRLTDGHQVAIKLLRAAVAHDTVAADRLRREAAALGLTWHPNVVEIYDDGHLPDGTSYLVMERLYGQSLADRLKQQGALEPSEILAIGVQVCDALGAVHAAGVVHRDLKPSNIFLARVTSDDSAELALTPRPAELASGDRVKLLDFGVARVEWAETRITNAGAPLGTPGYMSPEQEHGLEIDLRSDLYALGGVLYECFTGQRPPLHSWELRQPGESDHSESGVQRALTALPAAWREVIECATSELPRDRYPDARSMREALVNAERERREAEAQSVG